MKKLAIDSYYYSETDSYSVGFVFDTWADSSPVKVLESHVSNFGPYIPGEFYKRELPGVLSIVHQIDLLEFDTIIIDGYVSMVDKDFNELPGLGMKLSEKIEMHDKLTIIGVAKSLFGRSDITSIPVIRGEASTPIWVSSVGEFDNLSTSKLIKSMAGKYKLPDILKLLDKETKKFKNHDEFNKETFQKTSI